MSGWILLAAIALGAGVVLLAIGFPRRLWTIGATALTLGAAGYALQGSPDLPGHPVTTAELAVQVDPDLIALREAMFGRFNFSYTYFSAADSMTRIGSPGAAVKVMLGAVAKGPEDNGAWTGLGLALADHDHGLSPAAKFAFERAMALNPRHPGPPFFYGLALIRSGQFADARQYWAQAVQLTPEAMSYRPALVERLDRLDQFLAAMAARQAGQTPAP